MHAPATTPELGRHPEPGHHLSPTSLLLLHRANDAIFHSYFRPPSAARVTTPSSPPFSAPHRPPKSAGRSRQQPSSTSHLCTTSPARGSAAPPPGVPPPNSPETIRPALPMSCFPPSSPPESAARRAHLRGTPSPSDHDSPDTLPAVRRRHAVEPPPPLLRCRRRSRHRSPSPPPAIIATVRPSHAVHPTPPFVPRSATFTHPIDTHPYSRPSAGTEVPPPMTAPSVSHPPSHVAGLSTNRLLPSSPPHHAPRHLLSDDFLCAPTITASPPPTHTTGEPHAHSGGRREPTDLHGPPTRNSAAGIRASPLRQPKLHISPHQTHCFHELHLPPYLSPETPPKYGLHLQTCHPPSRPMCRPSDRCTTATPVSVAPKPSPALPNRAILVIADVRLPPPSCVHVIVSGVEMC